MEIPLYDTVDRLCPAKAFFSKESTGLVTILALSGQAAHQFAAGPLLIAVQLLWKAVARTYQVTTKTKRSSVSPLNSKEN